jgi:hypothetical protein
MYIKYFLYFRVPKKVQKLKGNREQGTGNREIPIIEIRGFV